VEDPEGYKILGVDVGVFVEEGAELGI